MNKRAFTVVFFCICSFMPFVVSAQTVNCSYYNPQIAVNTVAAGQILPEIYTLSVPFSGTYYSTLTNTQIAFASSTCVTTGGSSGGGGTTTVSLSDAVDNANLDYFFGILIFMLSAWFVVWFFRGGRRA